LEHFRGGAKSIAALSRIGHSQSRISGLRPLARFRHTSAVSLDCGKSKGQDRIPGAHDRKEHDIPGRAQVHERNHCGLDDDKPADARHRSAMKNPFSRVIEAVKGAGNDSERSRHDTETHFELKAGVL
jgi:hypothetical protein